MSGAARYGQATTGTWHVTKRPVIRDDWALTACVLDWIKFTESELPANARLCGNCARTKFFRELSG